MTATPPPPPPLPEPGKPGEPGTANGAGGKGGRGGRGGIGLTGPAGGWTDRAMAFLIAALTVVFGFLFARVSINQHEIEKANWVACQLTVEARQAYNQQQEDLGDVAAAHLEVPGNAERVRIYRNGAITIPDCGPNPDESPDPARP